VSASVITIAQQKGGAGKTSLAVHLGVALQGRGRAVRLLDLDPQGSLSAWAEIRRERYGTRAPEVIAAPGFRAAGAISDAARGCDIVVIDTPPHAETILRPAVRRADLVLVPIQPSPMDAWAARPTIDGARRERRDVRIVLNRVPPRAALTDQVRSLLEEFDTPILDAALGNRVGFAAALMHGAGVSEVLPRSPAAAEINALADAVLEAL